MGEDWKKTYGMDHLQRRIKEGAPPFFEYWWVSRASWRFFASSSSVVRAITTLGAAIFFFKTRIIYLWRTKCKISSCVVTADACGMRTYTPAWTLVDNLVTSFNLPSVSFQMRYTGKEGMDARADYETDIIMTAVMMPSFACHEESGKDSSAVFTSITGKPHLLT